MADIFSGAYTSNGSRGGVGSGGGGDKSSHGVQELNGLTWQGDHELEDSRIGMSGSAGGGGGDISPRRRSYLWKRPTAKPGAGTTVDRGQSDASSNDLVRPNSAGATATAAAQEAGVTNELLDGSFFVDKREDQGTAASVVGESGEGGAPPAPPPSFAAVEGGEDSPGRAMMGGGGGGGTVQLMGGIADGGEDHQFRVRGASFLDDGLEVRKSKSCLLVDRVCLQCTGLLVSCLFWVCVLCCCLFCSFDCCGFCTNLPTAGTGCVHIRSILRIFVSRHSGGSLGETTTDGWCA